jgi:uncharacterized membrane protein YdjX (TVP38/TMEM64 family)
MRAMLTILFSVIASAAFAHPSVVAHEHPHGSSLLPHLALLIIGVIAVVGATVVLHTRRRGRS